MPRWSELREVVRPRRLAGDATARRLARAATIGDLRAIARRRVPARGLRLHRRRRRGGDQPPPLPGGVRAGGVRAPGAARRLRGRPVDDAAGRPLGTPAGLRADRVHPPHAHRGGVGGRPGRRTDRRPVRAVDDGHHVGGGAGRGGAREPGGGSSCTSGGTGRPAPPSSSGPAPPATRRSS